MTYSTISNRVGTMKRKGGFASTFQCLFRSLNSEGLRFLNSVGLDYVLTDGYYILNMTESCILCDFRSYKLCDISKAENIQLKVIEY